VKLLKDKKILITGGASGIGLAIAEACVKEGASVIIAARSQQKLDDAATLLKKLLPNNETPKIMAVKTDVTSDNDLEYLINKIKQEYGSLDSLIASAGLYGTIGPFLDTPINEWAKSVEINLIGAAKSVYYAAKIMNPAKPSQVVLFSGGGQGAYENFSAYVTGKGGIWRFTESVGAELAKRNIFMNAMTPGPVNTQFLDDLIAAGPNKVGQEAYEKSLRQKKEGGQSPTKAVDLCLYLLSEKSAGLYGKTISAIWDNYQNFADLGKMSCTDIYTFKRVVEADGGTRPPR
jgi:3-oxoacyl-[acyl-carrier protein] reductase